MHHHDDCPHCHALHSVTAPSRLWSWALAPTWLALGTMVALSGLIGPFIMFVGPVVMFSGACLLGALYSRAHEPPTCEECGKIVERTPGAQAREMRAEHHAAHAA
jgi:hypothetical protein